VVLALRCTAVRTGLGVVQILLFIGFLELFLWQQKPENAPGDIGGKSWVRYSDPDVKQDKLNKELNNGRLAQMAIMGMMVG
jgi:Chlorophyll A-B binding protein